MATVIILRRKYGKENIFSTSIRLSMNKTSSDDIGFKDRQPPKKIFDFDFAELKTDFGEAIALPLANHFYTFNQLFQNPLCGNAFTDMAQYLPYVKTMGGSLKIGAKKISSISLRELCKFFVMVRNSGHMGLMTL